MICKLFFFNIQIHFQTNTKVISYISINRSKIRNLNIAVSIKFEFVVISIDDLRLSENNPPEKNN